MKDEDVVDILTSIGSTTSESSVPTMVVPPLSSPMVQGQLEGRESGERERERMDPSGGDISMTELLIVAAHASILSICVR